MEAKDCLVTMVKFCLDKKVEKALKEKMVLQVLGVGKVQKEFLEEPVTKVPEEFLEIGEKGQKMESQADQVLLDSKAVRDLQDRPASTGRRDKRDLKEIQE